MKPGGPQRAQSTALLLAAATSIYALPGALFPPLWLVALLAPAWLLVALRPLPRRRWFGEREHLLVAGVVQVAAVWFAWRALPDLRREALLASVLLPPLAFMTLRRRGSDPLLALFLALCLLLIGTMLAPQDALLPCVLFVAAGAIVLHADAELLGLSLRHAARQAAPHSWHRFRERWLGATAVAAIALANFVVLRVLPAPVTPPTRQPARSGADAGRRIGLSQSFDLTGAPSVPLEVVGEELLEVRPWRVGGQVPDDLYLRSTFFDVAGLDRWSLRPVRSRVTNCEGRPFAIGTEFARLPTLELVFRRIDESSGLVLVPPGAVKIGGIERLAYDLQRGWFHEQEPKGPLEYTIAFQDRAALAHGARVRSAPELVQLPAEVRTQALLELTQEFTRTGPETHPALLAAALSRGLQRRCEYELAEPRGPSAHALWNFLFGSRRGYCMHFATALAVMLRLRGVPCRIAVGLQGGRADPDEPDLRRFGSRHAHAWVEIPFEELGWIAFDATPPAALPSTLGRGEAAGAAIEPGDAAGAPRSSPMQRLVGWLEDGGSARVIWVAAGALVILLLLRADLRPTRRTIQAESKDQRSARRMLGEILKTLRDRGHARAPGQTLESWVEALRPRADLPIPALARAVAVYQEVRFGGYAFDGERRDALATCVERLG